MTKTHKGSCHCGAVTFEVELDPSSGTMCNCRICTKLGIRSAIAKPEQLRETSDPAKHGEYPNAIGKRVFCPTCGVHCFGYGDLPELGGKFASVDINALDTIDPYTVQLMHWDGRHDNWHAGPSSQPFPIFTS